MKDRLITILFVLFAFGASLKAQESVENPIKKLFLDQISFFPQEKIYVQTDRSKYLPGETIWFRVHLVDAVFFNRLMPAAMYMWNLLIPPIILLNE